ncbi:MAG: 2-amino-4-hydroxy-6-hydroxymethyldihydropteridine diphosphokinase, partial [Chloroflexota bacterium]
MTIAYLGLGSNLGDREGQLRRALETLPPMVKVECLSALYETEPEGGLPRPLYLNAVCRISTSLSPQELLALAKEIEKELGRQPGPANSPRPVDIDILFYDDLVLDSERLTIPHPRLAQRAFALVPLAEIAPQIVHPQLGTSAKALLELVNKKGVTLWKGAPRLRGHHLMCIIGFRGYGYSDIHRDRLADVQRRLFSQPFARVEVVIGDDDICIACPWLKQQRCYSDDDVERGSERQEASIAS